MIERKNVPKRILSSVLSSLSAGVVPRLGAPYVAIGRKDEINAILNDLENVSAGGAGMRFLVGRYGSGKSFLMQLIRGYALEKGFLTADADLSPERRLYGSGNTGVATYRELIKNMAAISSPSGGALPVILSKWAETLQLESGNRDVDCIGKMIRRTLLEIQNCVGGFDFSLVISTYFNCLFSEESEAVLYRKNACLQWLRGEFSTKTEACNALGFRVSSIVDDSNWYNYIKLWAALSQKIGYRGLVIFIDECVNLYKIVNRVSRENNYEMILSMFNDTLQGNAVGLEMILGGTPQFLEDTRRGLFSYEALRSRLADGAFSAAGSMDLLSPVIRLKRLTDDELFALILRVADLHAQYYGYDRLLNDEEQMTFYKKCLSRIGADEMITPREIIRDYLSVLNVLYQNKEMTFERLMAGEGASVKETVPGKIVQDSDNVAENERKNYTAKDIEF